MKTDKLFAIISLLLAGLYLSCYDDKGNYDYAWMPEVHFLTINDTVIGRGEVLTIDPKFVAEKAKNHYSTVYENVQLNPDNYTYEWKAEKLNAGSETGEKRFILSEEKILDTTILLQIRTEPYLVTYTMKEKKTGIAYKTGFKLTVSGGIYDGFFFLTEDENKQVELEMYGRNIALNRFLEKGMLQKSGFPYRGGGANCICYYVASNNAKKLWVATGEATGWLDIVNYEWKSTSVARMLMAKPEPISYTFKNIVGGLYFFTENGQMHPLNNYDIMSTDVGYVGGRKIQLYPGVASYQMGVLVYDKTNKRFVTFKWSTMMGGDSDCKTIGEPEAATGKELLYMQKIFKEAFTIAVMKSETGELWRYTYFDEKFSPFTPKLAESPVLLSNSGQLANAEQIVIDNNNGFIYFSVGSQLYVYRSGQGAQPVAIRDDEGQPIQITAPIVKLQTIQLSTYNKPAYYVQYNDCIMVATYDSSKGDAGGTCYLLRPNPVESKDLTLYEEPITGLGKVKSISYQHR